MADAVTQAVSDVNNVITKLSADVETQIQNMITEGVAAYLEKTKVKLEWWWLPAIFAAGFLAGKFLDFHL